MTLDDHLRRARRRLREAGLAPEEAALDADLLARHALGWDRARLLAALAEPVPEGFAATYAAVVDRRAGREPAAYILGHREFWGLDFEVSPGVLVPRPETEFLVEETLRIFSGRPAATLAAADVGTGSGCLAVALAHTLPGSRFVATDISAAALQVARLNARRHGVESQVTFVRADLLAGVAGPFDLIVSNPPYVPTGSVPGLQVEIRSHEPMVALDGGRDGLVIVRRLLAQARTGLRPGGWLILEFGFSQEAALRAAVATHDGLLLHHIGRDLQGIPRTGAVRRTERV